MGLDKETKVTSRECRFKKMDKGGDEETGRGIQR